MREHRRAMGRGFSTVRMAWRRLDDVVYEARLVNRELGQYKGYPLDRSEWPEKLNEVSEDDGQ